MNSDAYKIMIVEDESPIATQLDERLTSLGYEIVGCPSSGEEAINIARSQKPDIILMDIVMPGKYDGIDAAKIIKSEMDVCVIYLTAFSGDKIINRAKHTDPSSFLLKPIKTDQLKASLRMAMLKEQGTVHKQMELYKLQGIWDTSICAFALADLKGYLIYVNPAFIKLWGYCSKKLFYHESPSCRENCHKKDAVLKRIYQNNIVEYMHEEERAWLINKLHNKTNFKGNLIAERKDGSNFLTQFSTSFIIDNNMKPGHLLFSFIDINEQNQFMVILKIQHDLSASLGKADSLDDALELLLKSVCSIEEISGGGIYLINKYTDDVELISYMGLSPHFAESVSRFPGSSLQLSIIRKGKPVYGKDTEASTIPEKLHQAEGILSTAIIPIKYRNRVIGSINLISRIISELSFQTRSLLESIAAQAGEVISRLETENELKTTKINNLSPREREFLRNLSTGLSRKEISRTMYISEATYDTYFRRIRLKQSLKNRAEVFKFAFENKNFL